MADTTDPKVVVMVCMDGSEHSKYALKFYAENIHQQDNKVILAHCGQYVSFNYGNVSVLSSSPGVVEKIINEEEHRIKLLMGDMEKEMIELGIKNGEIERLQGEVGHEILERAKAVGATFIITGTRGLGKVRRTLLGSVSDYLVHHSTVPVLVCKHPHFHHDHHNSESKE